MTNKEAEQEALARWGKHGVVLRRRARQIENGLPPYAVGISDGQIFETLGQGETWEEAFRNADHGRR